MINRRSPIARGWMSDGYPHERDENGTCKSCDATKQENHYRLLPPTPSPTTVAREAAHQAVKAFDLKPNLTNTTAAIEALSEYEQHLKEAEQ